MRSGRIIGEQCVKLISMFDESTEADCLLARFVAACRSGSVLRSRKGPPLQGCCYRDSQPISATNAHTHTQIETQQEKNTLTDFAIEKVLCVCVFHSLLHSVLGNLTQLFTHSLTNRKPEKAQSSTDSKVLPAHEQINSFPHGRLSVYARCEKRSTNLRVKSLIT